MGGQFPFSVEILKVYFNDMDITVGSSRIKADLFSDDRRLSFQISKTTSEQSFKAAFPQARFSLERHGIGPGHPGVHMQLKYHLIENPVNLGSLYIFIDIDAEEQMMEIAKGFIHALYEMTGMLNDEFREIRRLMFREELISELETSSEMYRKKIKDSIEKKTIEIRSLDGTIGYLTPRDISSLVDRRKELLPLLGMGD
jgi:hypothetical protein